MSGDDTAAKRGRPATVVLLGGPVAGAALGAVESGHDKSIRDQITESFTPGARDAQRHLAQPIVVCEIH